MCLWLLLLLYLDQIRWLGLEGVFWFGLVRRSIFAVFCGIGFLRNCIPTYEFKKNRVKTNSIRVPVPATIRIQMNIYLISRPKSQESYKKKLPGWYDNWVYFQGVLICENYNFQQPSWFTYIEVSILANNWQKTIPALCAQKHLITSTWY